MVHHGQDKVAVAQTVYLACLRHRRSKPRPVWISAQIHANIDKLKKTLHEIIHDLNSHVKSKPLHRRTDCMDTIRKFDEHLATLEFAKRSFRITSNALLVYMQMGGIRLKNEIRQREEILLRLERLDSFLQPQSPNAQHLCQKLRIKCETLRSLNKVVHDVGLLPNLRTITRSSRSLPRARVPRRLASLADS